MSAFSEQSVVPSYSVSICCSVRVLLLHVPFLWDGATYTLMLSPLKLELSVKDM